MHNPNPVDPSGDLLAIDPSICSAGVALFRAGKLLACTNIEPDVESDEMGVRVQAMAHEILSWVVAVVAEPRVVVYEWPQVYSGGKQKTPGGDLLGLSAVGAAAAAALAVALVPRSIAPRIITPEPARWIGQVPKDKTVRGAKKSARGVRIIGRLDSEEAILVPSQHDVIDAVGIGLWALGRLTPARVYPR